MKNTNKTKFVGFGSSLCWWANIDYPENIKNELIELLFGLDGLQLNILRYNLGGGSNETIKQNFRLGGNVPCIQNKNGTFDLTNDYLQLDILNKATALSVNKVELFSNSPPHWMCKSKVTNGNTIPFNCNLKSDCIDNFANFLCKSYDILSKQYPIVSVSPFNEPSNPFWSPKISQEGCYYDYNTRNKVISKIKTKNEKVLIVASDESHSLFALLSFFFINKVDRINIHGYNHFDWHTIKFNWFDWGIWRTLLKWITNKPIWMSEYGMGYTDTMADSLPLARHIFRDLFTLEPEAWIYWQVIENVNSDWGLITVDFECPKKIKIKKQYYIFKHFTRTLVENDTYKFVNDHILEIENDTYLKYIVLNDTTVPITNNIIQQYEYTNCYISNDTCDYTGILLPNHFQPNTITSITFSKNK